MNTQPLDISQLKDVPSTLLIPLLARANETQLNQPRFTDQKSLKILNDLNHPNLKGQLTPLMHWAIITRTIILDRLLKEVLKAHPSIIVINLGCGLDTRYERWKDKIPL